MQVISALIGVLAGGAISFTVQRVESHRVTRARQGGQFALTRILHFFEEAARFSKSAPSI